MTQPFTYKDAGVDIDAGEKATRLIKELVRKTSNQHVLSEVGSFGGLFQMAGSPEKNPVLVSSIDSVGTKTKIAVAMGRYDTIGLDIVNHCTNDILVQGARPLFFLDYIALGHLEPEQIATIVRGVSEGCIANQCVLIGGEMCEMPDVYTGGDIDLVGCIVGVVDRPRVLNATQVQDGDLLIGLESSGLHTNGYTLARKALYGDNPDKLNQPLEGSEGTLGEALLQPHRSYLSPIWSLLDKGLVHSMAHITGGGITGNLCRVIPPHLQAVVYAKTWEPQPIFKLLAKVTQAPPQELYRTFNMGVGMILVISPRDRDLVLASLMDSGQPAWEIGRMIPRRENAPPVAMVFD